MQNRVFNDNMRKRQSELLVEIEDIMDGIDETTYSQNLEDFHLHLPICIVLQLMLL
jgi:hypothetical protein